MEEDLLGSGVVRTLPSISLSLCSRSKLIEPLKKRIPDTSVRKALYTSPMTAEFANVRFDTRILNRSAASTSALGHGKPRLPLPGSPKKLGANFVELALPDDHRLTQSSHLVGDLLKQQQSQRSKKDLTNAPSSASLATTAKAARTPGEEETLALSIERIRKYTGLLEAHSIHHFVIWKGKRLDGTPEFAAFRRRYAVRWVAIAKLITLLEYLCLERNTLLALVDGVAMDALARCDGAKMKLADLLACVHNLDDFEDDSKMPMMTRRKKATWALDEAERPVTEAERVGMYVKIQTILRRRLGRVRHNDLRAMRQAATRIAATARCFLAKRRLFVSLKRRRRAEETLWGELQQSFRAKAPLYFEQHDNTEVEPLQRRRNRRVEVHLPSVGLSERERLSRGDFQLVQAQQIARLCTARGSHVHVVYVSPIPLDQEVMAYYERLTSLNKTSEDDDARCTVVVAGEGRTHFASHSTLAALLLYSPASCRRIAALCLNSFGYIVPGGPVGADERKLALRLKLPLLGPEPEVSALYGSRSGYKRAMRDADLNVPLGAHDIYDDDDLLIALAKLIASQLDVPRWKVVVDADSTAVAYLDVDDWPLVRELRSERRRLTEVDAKKGNRTWQRADVQTLARSKLLKQLPAFLRERCVVCYPNGETISTTREGGWSEFASLLRRSGAVIEAEPRRIKGRPAVLALIAPDGRCTIVGTHDTLTNARYERIAAVCPATTAPQEALRGATLALCGRLFEGGVIGYINLHFLANYTSESKLRVWATDLELGLNTPISASHLLYSGLSIDKQGSYVILPRIEHAGLGATKLGAFFKLCRLHSVAFDVDQRRGQLFLPFAALSCGELGCLTFGDDRKDAINLALDALNFLKNNLTTHHVIYNHAEEHQKAENDMEDILRLLSQILLSTD